MTSLDNVFQIAVSCLVREGCRLSGDFEIADGTQELSVAYDHLNSSLTLPKLQSNLESPNPTSGATG